MSTPHLGATFRQVQTAWDGWRGRGFELGLGIGITTGYATLGRIGFEGRYDYAAIGSTVNLASRLCDAEGLPQAGGRVPPHRRSRLAGPAGSIVRPADPTDPVALLSNMTGSTEVLREEQR